MMYVCMCVYIYIYIHIHYIYIGIDNVHVYTCLYIYIYIYICNTHIFGETLKPYQVNVAVRLIFAEISRILSSQNWP